MKKYLTPEVEMYNVEVEDIIATSNKPPKVETEEDPL